MDLEIFQVFILTIKSSRIRKISEKHWEPTNKKVDTCYNQSQNDDGDKNYKHLIFIEHLYLLVTVLEAYINSLDSSYQAHYKTITGFGHRLYICDRTNFA